MVLGGPSSPIISYYDSGSRVPCFCLGHGGLGNYWHGVIPLSLRPAYVNGCEAEFRSLLGHFYPGRALQDEVGRNRLFVPLRPIRPRREWLRLTADRGPLLDIRFETASRLELRAGRVLVITEQARYEARRVWLAAGTFGSAMLLRRSGLISDNRRSVSDHAICYLGQVPGSRAVGLGMAGRNRHGYLLDVGDGASGRAVVSLKPARFDYRILDRGIQQRAAFGLPIAGAIGKILRASSPGLLSEALFNKFGLFPRASVYSAYAQVAVPNALEMGSDGSVEVCRERYVEACTVARSAIDLPGITPSRIPEPFIFGIHTHGSLPESAASIADGMVKVVDSSVLCGVGAEHHSFYVMSLAHRSVRRGEDIP